MAGMSTRTDDPDNSHIMYNHVDCAVSEFELSESVSENSESSSESDLMSVLRLVYLKIQLLLSRNLILKIQLLMMAFCWS